jgi:3-deoxy-D-manno-octulosonate 8-phosphate phosphatase (KDO 8-P phosphatase)
MYKPSVYDSFFKIRAIVLDIDGVCTDNTILVTDHGEFLRSMNVRDGLAIKKAIQAGFQLAVISGGRSQGTHKRFQLLGITEIHLGIEHKIAVLENLLAKWNLKMEQVAYMGDDLTDVEILSKVGLAACPKDSVPEVLKVSHYISPLDGGKACVRDLIEKILQAQGTW